jgi:adenylylsulfate reductase subunit B
MISVVTHLYGEMHENNIYMAIMKAVVMDIRVDPELCSGCGLCIIICPQGIFGLQEGVSQADSPEECLVCHLCEVACEYEAITIRE